MVLVSSAFVGRLLARILLCLSLAAFFIMLSLFLPSSSVEAKANDRVHWNCWNSGVAFSTTGDTSMKADTEFGSQASDGWGHDNAYTILWEDMHRFGGENYNYEQVLTPNQRGFGDPPWESWTGDKRSLGFFYSMAEQVEYMFAMDIAQDSPDMKAAVKENDFLSLKFNNVFYLNHQNVKSNNAVSLPWARDKSGSDVRDVYLKQRAVAMPNKSMRSFARPCGRTGTTPRGACARTRWPRSGTPTLRRRTSRLQRLST